MGNLPRNGHVRPSYPPKSCGKRWSGMSFTARYPGECAECGGQLIGAEVAFTMSDDLVHVSCPRQTTELQQPVCSTHFIELPVSGVCEMCE